MGAGGNPHLGTGMARDGAVAVGQPRQQRSMGWISQGAPRSVGLPAWPQCRGARPGYCFADKGFQSAPASRGEQPPPPQTQVAIVEEERLFLYTVQMLSTCLQLGRKPCPVTDRCKVLYSLCLGLSD